MAYELLQSYSKLHWDPFGFDPAEQPQTIAFWLYPLETTSILRPVFGVRSSERPVFTESVSIVFLHSSGRLGFQTGYDTTDLYRISTASAIGINQWHHVAATYDGTTSASGVALYVDGNAAEIDTDSDQDGVGTALAGDESWYLDGTFDVRVAEGALWNRILGDAAIATLANRFSPLAMPRSLKWAPPLVRGPRDPISGTPGGATGATVVAHPPIIYPGRPQLGPHGLTATTKVPWHLFTGSAV